MKNLENLKPQFPAIYNYLEKNGPPARKSPMIGIENIKNLNISNSLSASNQMKNLMH